MQLHMVNWVDLFIILVLGLSTLISLVRGFVREALSLVSWIVAFWIAISYSSSLAALLVGHISQSTVRMAIAFGSLFIITLIIAAIINHLVSSLVHRTGLSGTDRILGIAFGFSRGLIFMSLLLILGNLTPLPKQEAWHTSLLVPAFHPIESWLTRFLPDKITTKLPDQEISNHIENLPISREN